MTAPTPAVDMTTPKQDYTREDLVALCERAFVPHAKWRNRDTADAQRQLGECYALLRAGCDFVILDGRYGLTTDERTVWVEITFRGFAYFDYDGDWNTETFYLPTAPRLDRRDGGDWY
jgi:uncharacterized protein (DUF1684 family)